MTKATGLYTFIGFLSHISLAFTGLLDHCWHAKCDRFSFGLRHASLDRVSNTFGSKECGLVTLTLRRNLPSLRMAFVPHREITFRYWPDRGSLTKMRHKGVRLVWLSVMVARNVLRYGDDGEESNKEQ